ncbi:alanine:cation symporter family protein [Brachybacterium sp. JHP9]|uniref:Alanine:cation symporter family protein n=1 Tax=Brachybacterium equifaecis TaxID=2910770 RepID=A0ABT0R103_9MICO|nr:alanine/glycine:cation symporter family protein [Brachybacterium equifaecis]MCL6423123.1 alanine:cation symporter family protein [Brachybacterium equifaecis]
MFTDLVDSANNLIWSLPLVVLCLLAGLYFSLRTMFLQVRGTPDMLEQLRKGEASPDGTSSLQSLMMSLAGRVGMGNIGGVATAIALGGPGAVFWMWVMAFLGAATSFVECTLGQIYKEKDKDTGEYRGGPAYYIEKAYKGTAVAGAFKVYAIVFAIVTVFAMCFFLPGVQANGIAASVENAWSIAPWITGLVTLAVLAVIVIGGVKRIANFAVVVVPVMAIVYILAVAVVFLMNFEQIPHVFGLIFSSAFGINPIFGAIVGKAIEMGVKRGLYSNEAGQGTGPHAAAAAEVSHPAKQGYAQSFAVYVDTLFVCTATAFLLLSTNAFHVTSPDGEVLYGDGIVATDVEPGPIFSQTAFDSVVPHFGPTFVALALIFFCFTTILAYYYMAEVNLAYLMRWVPNRAVRRVLITCLQVLILISVLVGATSTGGAAWALGDIGVGSMAWLNIVAILILQGPALKALKDYHEQKRRGIDPQFDPRPLGIINADFWEARADGRARSGADSAANDAGTTGTGSHRR